MTETIRLAKYHGLGNDFLVATDPLPAGVDAADLARQVCDRHRGVGADGLLLCSVGGPGGADLTMVLHNADGSRAEMSGNGIRCLVHAAIDAGLVKPPEPLPAPEEVGDEGFRPDLATVHVATDAGRRDVTATQAGPGILHASVEMGELRVDEAPAGLADAFGGEERLAVDAGNPHLVVRFADRAYLDEAADDAARRSWPVNLELIAPGPDRGRIHMRVIERGVGETLACGTGACAAALAAVRWGLADDEVIVHQRGGDASVTIGDGRAVLSGPSVFVAAVEVPLG